MTYYLWSL